MARLRWPLQRWAATARATSTTIAPLTTATVPGIPKPAASAEVGLEGWARGRSGGSGGGGGGEGGAGIAGGVGGVEGSSGGEQGDCGDAGAADV